MLLGGLIALGAAIAVAMLSLVILVYAATSHFYGGPGDYFAAAVWLTGLSLGVPVHEVGSITVPAGRELVTSATEGRAIAWLLTAIVLVLVFRLMQRRERSRPSAGLAQVTVRALLTALVVTLILLVLALVTTRGSVFGLQPESPDTTGVHSSLSIGLEPGFVFAGPLLLTAVAALAGTATATSLSAHQRVAGKLARWSPVLRLAWRQVLVIGVLTGVTLLVYASAETGQHRGGRETAVAVLGLVLMLPNLAIYGTLGGFGSTFYATIRTTSLGLKPESSNSSHSIGIFGSFRPWIVWLILAAAVAGTLLPALLARRAERAGRIRGTDYPLSGVWRATLAGFATALAVVLLGAFSYDAVSSSDASPSSSSFLSLQLIGSAGPSLLAAAGLTAVWISLGYLATSVAVRARSS